MADVKLSFALVISMPAGTPLRTSDVAKGGAAFSRAVAKGVATLLGVTEAQVFVANLTDVATGASIAAPSTSGRRRAAAAPGSLGVSVGIVVNLGKTPTEQATLDLQSKLTASGTPAMQALQAAVVQAVSAATTVPASYFAVSAPSGTSFANSPFIAAVVPGAASSSDGGAGGAGGGGAIGGAVGGVIALVLAIWSWRSYAKHGTLPCCRDRKRELFVKRANQTETVEVSSALAEAAAIVVADGGSPGAGGSSKAAVIKRLAEKAKAADAATAELAELKKQLAAAKANDVDADEVAQLRAQLKAAKAASEKAAFLPQEAKR